MAGLGKIRMLIAGLAAVIIIGMNGGPLLYNLWHMKDTKREEEFDLKVKEAFTQSHLNVLEDIIESYKESHYSPEPGIYPQSLEEITKFVKEEYGGYTHLVEDPFTAKPGRGKLNSLIYHPSADRTSYLLYSVGPNEKDNNGKEDDITLGEIIKKKEIIKQTLPKITEALEDYKNSSGNFGQKKYPKSLEGISNFVEDKYGVSIIDPLNTQREPFRYQTEEDRTSYLLYSVGPDSADDHGGGDDISYKKE